jgi:hypothetical protein
MSTSKPYYTLVVKRAGVWSAQFGDYDREVVKDEEYDCYDTEVSKIIKTADNQAAIDFYIAVMNGVQKA